jgi:tRNA(adenine34) deaminase
MEPASPGAPLPTDRVPVSRGTLGSPVQDPPPGLKPASELGGVPRPLDRPGGVLQLLAEGPREGDRMWMARALEQARAAWLVGEVPVGAVVVFEGRLVGEGGNRTLSWTDPTAHAEVVALRAAARRLGTARLPGATLYVTLEPCAQCAGSAVLARLARLVYGASDPKAGMVGSLGNLVQDPRLNHRLPVTAGVLAAPSAQLLRAFFRERR